MSDPNAIDVDRIIEAYISRSWAALGHSSWEAYITSEYGDRRPEMLLSQRRAIAAKMHDAGLTVRAIGTVLGLHFTTAHRDATGRTRVSREESVYVIGSPEFRPVKIGKGNVARRLEWFQTGSPFLLEVLWSLPGGYRLERALHARFKPFRVRGEWYEFPAGVDPVGLVSAAAEEVSAALSS